MHDINREPSASSPETDRLNDALKLLGGVTQEIPSTRDAMLRIAISDLAMDVHARLTSGIENARQEAVMLLDAKIPEVRAALRDKVTENTGEMQSAAINVLHYAKILRARHAAQREALGEQPHARHPVDEQETIEERRGRTDVALASLLEEIGDVRVSVPNEEIRARVHEFYEQARIGMLERRRFFETKDRETQLLSAANVIAQAHILVRDEMRRLGLMHVPEAR